MLPNGSHGAAHEESGAMDWSRIDGEARQAVADRLWSAWRDGTHAAGLVVGFSGVGKTDKLARALKVAARDLDRTAVSVDMPPIGIDAQAELIAELADALDHQGADADLVADVENARSLKSALKDTVKAGVLVVVDDIQRQFDADGSPPKWLNNAMSSLLDPDPDPERGWVLLLSNRAVDESLWVERCRCEIFGSPKTDPEATRAILETARSGTVAQLGPRLVEVIDRLGANPRALGLLARQLEYAPLDELLGPAEPAATMTDDPLLVEKLETHIVERAADGLAPEARTLMLRLSVLRTPAPFELVEAIGEGLDLRKALKALRERRLSRAGNREALNPVAVEVGRTRLRGDQAAWRDAHQRAGRWYARPLVKGLSGRLASYAGRLSSALYHLEHSGDAGLYGRVMQAARAAVVEAFDDWDARNPSNARERDAQIDLLQLVLKEPGPNAAHYQLAKRLLDRADPDDLPLARDHARRGTHEQSKSKPWVLRIKSTWAADGLEAGVRAAQEAAKEAQPEGIYLIYRLLGAALVSLGRPIDAIEALWLGLQREQSVSRARLAENALYCAAAEADPSLLTGLRERVAATDGLAPQVALGEVLASQQRGAWVEAAHIAAEGLSIQPDYLHLALHQALAELGAGRPEAALAALNSFPIPWRHRHRQANTWLFAAVHLLLEQPVLAAGYLDTYLGASSPREPQALRAAILHEWDTRVGSAARIGEANPAFLFPNLPQTLTGLSRVVRRPQYGPSVLPAHVTLPPGTPEAAPMPGPSHLPSEAQQTSDPVSGQSDPSPDHPRTAATRAWLAVATEWTSRKGGISTFNRRLCCALAAEGERVVCLVPDATADERTTARAAGVELVTAPPELGVDEFSRLRRRPTLPEGFAPTVVIGHGRITGPAARALVDDYYPTARRLHLLHMAPDEIEWFKPGRDDDAATRAEERSQQELELSRSSHRTVTIGPRLYNSFARDLREKVVRLDPGVDTPPLPAGPPPGKPHVVLAFGRMEDPQIKRPDLAAQATAEARREHDHSLELYVRGAPPGTGDAQRE